MLTTGWAEQLLIQESGTATLGGSPRNNTCSMELSTQHKKPAEMHFYSPDCYCIDMDCVNTNKDHHVLGLISTSLSTKSNLSLKHHDHFTKPILWRGQISSSVWWINEKHTQGKCEWLVLRRLFLFLFTHSTSLSYSDQAQSCSAFPSTFPCRTSTHQQCQTSSFSTKGCSSPRHKVWGLTQINPFSPETPNQRSSSNLLLKQSQEQRTEVGGGICSENSNVSKPEAPHERNFSPCSSMFFQTEEQTCSYFQPLYQTEKKILFRMKC